MTRAALRVWLYHPFELGHLCSSLQINSGVESAGMVYSHSQDVNHGKAVRFYCTLESVFNHF